MWFRSKYPRIHDVGKVAHGEAFKTSGKTPLRRIGYGLFLRLNDRIRHRDRQIS